jgi:hypothetical protein|tara:strand:- start:364 stop:849 length:486 start_codon:yes stop_codon:yes gene_type:complete
LFEIIDVEQRGKQPLLTKELKMTNTNKELDWDNPGQPEAEELFRSGRGGYIVGQALYKAIEVMEQEEHPEYSNIADMKLIMNHMYPIFMQFAAGLETFKKMREAGIEGLDLTGQTELTSSQEACLSSTHLKLYTKNRKNVERTGISDEEFFADTDRKALQH